MIEDNNVEKLYFTSGPTFESRQILRFGDRYSEYRKAFEAASRLELETDFPLYIMIEQSYNCNLKCKGCVLAYGDIVKKYSPNKVMNEELFDKILAEAQENALCSVSMHSVSEPLLVKNLPERVAKAKDAGIMDIILSTNGLLLTKEKAKALIDSGITHFLFSIDAATEETYAKIREPGGFEKVKTAIGYVREVKGDSATPITRASFVINALNEHEKDLFVTTFKDLVDYIDIQPFDIVEGRSEELIPSNCTRLEPEDVACNLPFTRVIVRANGDVLPCCGWYSNEMVMGNIYDSTIKDIWNSDNMKKLREESRTRSYTSPICKKCIRSKVKFD